LREPGLKGARTQGSQDRRDLRESRLEGTKTQGSQNSRESGPKGLKEPETKLIDIKKGMNKNFFSTPLQSYIPPVFYPFSPESLQSCIA